MKFVDKKPNLSVLHNYIKNYEYEDEFTQLSIEIPREEDLENTEFNISLRGLHEEAPIYLDTRISFERHKEDDKHNKPHLQWNINRTNDDFFENGRIHITLLVEDLDELDKCCRGFMLALAQIIRVIEIDLGLEEYELVEHFFYNNIEKLEEDKETLCKLIEQSIKKDEIKIIEHKLVEIQRRKTDKMSEYSKNKKIFFLLKLVYKLNILKPLLHAPIHSAFYKLPQISNMGVPIDKHEEIIEKLIEADINFERYTPELYIKKAKEYLM